MLKSFEYICNSIKEGLGYPVKLYELIKNSPNIAINFAEPKPNISFGSVVQWGGIGKAPHEKRTSRDQNTLLGWRHMEDGYYSSLFVKRSEFSEFVLMSKTDKWQCDIQQVVGFSSSKSELRKFLHLDEMVEADSPEMINEISESKLKKNLAHAGIRIIHCDNEDWFRQHLWDGRLFLMNSDGSHHFAAARYIAARLGNTIALIDKLEEYSLNEVAINRLQNDFYMYAISSETGIETGFRDAMQSFKATYFWHYLPEPYIKYPLILLPKNEARSQTVSNVLRMAGCFDMNSFFTELLERQYKNKVALSERY